MNMNKYGIDTDSVSIGDAVEIKGKQQIYRVVARMFNDFASILYFDDNGSSSIKLVNVNKITQRWLYVKSDNES